MGWDKVKPVLRNFFTAEKEKGIPIVKSFVTTFFDAQNIKNKDSFDKIICSSNLR